MAAPRNRKHILVSRHPQVDPYTPHGFGGKSKAPGAPAIGRPAHAAALRASLEQATRDAALRRTAAGITVHNAQPGVYVEFEAIPGWELALSSLERAAHDPLKRIEVVAVTDANSSTSGEAKAANAVQRATVFVPDGQISHFLKRLEKYALTTPKKEKERRYENMLDRVANVRLATLRALWTDDPSAFPSDNAPIWWEMWLRQSDGSELERLHEYAVLSGIKVRGRRLELVDRIIVLVRAARTQLAAALDVLNDVAELRRAKELATFFLDEPFEDQVAWSQDLVRRVVPPRNDAPAVTLLDTGVNRAHPLLAQAISPGDVHAVDAEWGGDDNGGGPKMMGHGTEMAGLALYGDLARVLASDVRVEHRHRLESVKLLPPARFGVNEPELYGAITAIAVSRPRDRGAPATTCVLDGPDSRWW